MSVTIIRKSTRLRRRSQLRHKPSGRGDGKWHNLRTFWAYKLHTRRRRNIAEASRRRNRR